MAKKRSNSMGPAKEGKADVKRLIKIHNMGYGKPTGPGNFKLPKNNATEVNKKAKRFKS